MSQVYTKIKKDDMRERVYHYPAGDITFSLEEHGSKNAYKEIKVKYSFESVLEHSSGEQLLNYSIAKWDYIVSLMRDSGEVINDGGTDTCALCHVYYEDGCEGCPIFKETGRDNCLGTPYSRYTEYRFGRAPFDDSYNGAVDMKNYLVRLRNKEQDGDCKTHVFKFDDWAKGALVAGAINGQSKIECSACGGMFRFTYYKKDDCWGICLGSVDKVFDWSISLTYPFRGGGVVKISIGE